MRGRLLLLLLMLGVAGCQSYDLPFTPIAGNTPSSQTAQHFEISQTRTLAANYLLFLPKGYSTNSAQRWPLILFLHGVGERGNNVWDVTNHGVPKTAAQSPDFPFIVVSPQCPDGEVWSQDILLALLDDVENRYAVDKHRVYLTGLSMGGYGAWELGLSHPERFAALAPVSGGGDVIGPVLARGAEADALKTLPVWAFHGARDPIVPAEESERMITVLKKLGVREVKLTIFPDAGHDCWTQTYTDPELYAWFLKHSR